MLRSHFLDQNLHQCFVRKWQCRHILDLSTVGLGLAISLMVAPPPPPLPPQPPSLPSLRLSTTRALKPKTTQHVTSQHRDQPSGNLVAAAKARITGLAPSTKPTTPDLQPFAPCHMFFYGSLMDPEVIETIAKLQSPAQVRTATITGFRVKMWGIYPTLIPDEHGKVDGVV